MAESSNHSQVRDFLIDQVNAHRRDIVSLTAETFGMTRQAVHRHLSKLVKEGIIESKGTTRNKQYTLVKSCFEQEIVLEKSLQEDMIWNSYIESFLNELPENILKICHYGFTEILNNAIDHSEGTKAVFSIERTAKDVHIMISDNGVGIFEKIKNRFGLQDSRHALLELAKGKLTTDPSRHTGEGIFFTSRMFDSFTILSKNSKYYYVNNKTDDLIDSSPGGQDYPGTLVSMYIIIKSMRTMRQVFDEFTHLQDDETYGFSKTVVPLRLARFGSEDLISRSQAKRVLNGIERFKEVVLDFESIPEIGQAFADEIFRVFARSHPEVKLVPVHANEDVTRMIRRAQAALKAEGGKEPSALA